MYKIIIPAIFCIFFFINTITLNDGHSWGDDFAQYIQHSVNLVEHKPYTSNILLDLWVVYPPGFPFLLSSLIYWFGVNFKVLKFLNVVLWALSSLAAYVLVLNLLDLFWARLITVWFLSSPFFFFFKQNVLSDIPFMCFVLLSLWTFMKYEEYQSKGINDLKRTFLFLSIICMSYALLIRWAGISLFLAVIVYFLAVKRDWKRSLGFILGAVISWVIALQCGSSAATYYDKTVSFQDWFRASWDNIVYIFQIILGFYISDKISSPKMALPAAIVLIKLFTELLLIGIIVLFVYRLYQRRVSFMGCFTFFYLIGVICWPIPGGTRYVLPIIIPITIYVIKSFKPALQKLPEVIFIFLILFNIFTIASNFKFNDDGIFQKGSLEMMQWVALNIKPGEHYMFYQPRALGLLTHRLGATFWVYPKDKNEWYKRIKALNINYLIEDKQVDELSRYNKFYLRVDNDVFYFYRVWENTRYKVFKVQISPVPIGPS